MLGIVSCPHIAAVDYSKFQQQYCSDEIEHRNRIHLECYVCERSGQYVWMCLHNDCLKVFCSEVPPNHVLSHYKRDSSHCLYLNLSNFRIWCHECNSEITLKSEAPEKEVAPKGLVGLQNLGNTCYMNSALQSLANTPPLVDFFLNLSLVSGPKPQVTRAFHRLIVDVWSRSDGYIAPQGLLYAMRHTHPMYRGFQQHDSQEFLRCLLDQIHEEMKVPSLEPLKQDSYSFEREDMSDFENGSSETEDYETCDSGVSEQSSQSEEPTRSLSRPSSPVSLDKLQWKPQVHLNPLGTPSRLRKQITYRSIISDVFNGTLLSSVQCLTCNRVSSRVETFQDLSLPIPSRDTMYILHQNNVSSGPMKCSHLHSSQPVLEVSGIRFEADETSGILESRDGGNVAAITIPQEVLDVVHPEIRGGSEANTTLVEEVIRKNSGYLKGWLSWLWDCVCYWIWGPQVSLHDCLSAFFSADELKGDNMYSCDKCQKLRNGVKYSRLMSCPEVLCIHLKRFRHEPALPSKISSHVSFPLTGLDLAPYMGKECKSGVSKYDLVSVICHHGHGGSSGHYTCLAKNRTTGEWYEFDDHAVTPVQSVASARAYILFYRKDNTKINRARERAERLEKSSCGEKERYYISKDWLVKFNSFSEPGPVDNRLLICQHDCLFPGADTVVVSGTVWKYLLTRFGGGPECPVDRLGFCDVCSEISGGESDLLRVQLHEFHRLQSHAAHEKHQISLFWLSNWENYVKGRTSTPPGPVTTRGGTCEISGGRWELLTSLYGLAQQTADSSESDSRSLDERISLENLDSGVWVQNVTEKGTTSDNCSIDIKAN